MQSDGKARHSRIRCPLQVHSGTASSSLTLKTSVSDFHTLQDGRAKAQEVQMNLKSFDAIQSRHSTLYDTLRDDIEKTFKIFTATLEERKAELLREAKSIYTERQMALSTYNQKAQEVMGKLMVVSSPSWFCSWCRFFSCTTFFYGLGNGLY